MSLDTLRVMHPWPDTKPDLAFDPHGWCLAEHRDFLRPHLSSATQCVIELGSWLGQSTRVLLELAPNATVICVDTWRGSTDMVGNADAEPRIQSGRLFDQFLANQWQYRDRVIPCRSDSRDAMVEIGELGIQPDLIFFDTEHTTDHLLAELSLARAWFPRAVLYGDDWGWPTVRTAVTTFAAEIGATAVGRGNAWVLQESRA